jgi:hypothetical protein
VDGIASGPATDRDGEGLSPLLDLDGFTGRLERLLVLVRAQQSKRKLIPTVDGQRLGLQAGFGVMAAL